MTSGLYNDRIRTIYQMLFEMATGNFYFRIAEGPHNDDLKKIEELFNKVAAQLLEAISQSGYVVPHYAYQGIVQWTFVLNKNLEIESVNAGAADDLAYPPEKLTELDFQKLLSVQSLDIWLKIVSELNSDVKYHNTLYLIFMTADQKTLPRFCTISRLFFTEKIFICSVSTILQNALADTFGPHNTSSKPDLAAIIQELHDYIISHLEDPLPTTRQLSKMFGTNEFKIKDGFRHFFNTSIYQFYNEQRLNKAHLLIQQSDVPLKEVALICGFNDYVNFYKAFKKKYSYTPSDVARPHDQDSEGRSE